MAKILIDLERLRYPNSGIANVFRNLAKGLEENNSKFEISYFGDKEQLEKFGPATNHVSWSKLHRFYERFSGDFDLIHVSHQLSSYFHRNYKKTIKVVTLHDLNFLHENLSEFKKIKMLGKVKNNVKNADYIVCISEYAKQNLIENKALFQFNKLKDIVVIHNGIQLPENREYHLGKYSFLKDKKYILNIGVLFNKKNQMTLVEMLPYIEDDLVLIASDEKQPYADEVRARIKELNIEKRVHFLKNLSEEEKYAVIQHADAMCHPSIAEGFGIPPIEAMAFGKPVFLSKYTSLPEIGGDKAFYFDSFDPKEMADVFNEKMALYNSEKEERSQEIKNWTKQYSYTEMSNNYLRFYEKVLGRN
ncbi:glycosyltransferase family 1 protein [Chryseobacterium lactis]|uniref:Glycosyltransferase family 1 protein n=1 Tax=Chryseobacterium lactis TaxID=1241981 RepID=A0A3G6RM16_CHRLC|nr:glycosyltransferase family 1 protein [Chryseobacterium lactis]AZA80934.1 glycosyltransferase family 1 protein [Chryseobacterium lactis]AZB05935.1 glycosyltransferase family 1 protein [Chryseobacterium lactis]PNW13345.1 glycosyltransferase family 1 protein [Chryseobacterium lactis]